MKKLVFAKTVSEQEKLWIENAFSVRHEESWIHPPEMYASYCSNVDEVLTHIAIDKLYGCSIMGFRVEETKPNNKYVVGNVGNLMGQEIEAKDKKEAVEKFMLIDSYRTTLRSYKFSTLYRKAYKL